jgi:flavin-binding protein dodecin
LVKKGIELIGTSEESFSQAVKTALKEAAVTIRDIEWLEVLEYSARVEKDAIIQYQAKIKVYFDVER